MISAEEIKALMRPKYWTVAGVNHEVIETNRTPCEPTREQQAILTLQTLLNQAAEALISAKQWPEYNSTERVIANALTAIQPYLLKEQTNDRQS